MFIRSRKQQRHRSSSLSRPMHFDQIIIVIKRKVLHIISRYIVDDEDISDVNYIPPRFLFGRFLTILCNIQGEKKINKICRFRFYSQLHNENRQFEIKYFFLTRGWLDFEMIFSFFSRFWAVDWNDLGKIFCWKIRSQFSFFCIIWSALSSPKCRAEAKYYSNYHCHCILFCIRTFIPLRYCAICYQTISLVFLCCKLQAKKLGSDVGILRKFSVAFKPNIYCFAVISRGRRVIAVKHRETT